ncbi:uncharacterized protein ARMOST_13308 [Armillaria ostoyae]|uniref:Uncharacterized protein n=1 Tax=Armillaria ostoyae TaxID=47428 RepID=A0A284RMD4_ARMOS|nr:uncharacterized protein ARMOST_13308 [Armillaria ostoyae]
MAMMNSSNVPVFLKAVKRREKVFQKIRICEAVNGNESNDDDGSTRFIGVDMILLVVEDALKRFSTGQQMDLNHQTPNHS